VLLAALHTGRTTANDVQRARFADSQSSIIAQLAKLMVCLNVGRGSPARYPARS
jgi:hypothetical protein